jgi:hypothetical protein
LHEISRGLAVRDQTYRPNPILRKIEWQLDVYVYLPCMDLLFVLIYPSIICYIKVDERIEIKYTDLFPEDVKDAMFSYALCTSTEMLSCFMLLTFLLPVSINVVQRAKFNVFTFLDETV